MYINVFAHMWMEFVDNNLIDMKGTTEIVNIYYKVMKKGSTSCGI